MYDNDSDSDSGEGEVKVIACEDWFVRLTGYREAEWRQMADKGIRQQADGGGLVVTNLKTNETFNAGTFSLQGLGDLVAEVQNSPPLRLGEVDLPPCILEIVTRSDGVRLPPPLPPPLPPYTL
jgi:hypothetical protein